MKTGKQRKAKKTGLFFSFEGGEGVGKTTQIAKLAALFEARGHKVVLTREPGGTNIANRIRSLLLDPKMDGLAPLAELFLYEASRAQHVQEVIRPALERGYVVICDRFADSSLVYQGAGRKLSAKLVKELNKIATGSLQPNITFVLDLNPQIGLARVGARGVLDRMEKEKLSFHQRVRSGFRRLVRAEPKRCILIDASRSRDDIHEAIVAKLGKYLGE